MACAGDAFVESSLMAVTLSERSGNVTAVERNQVMAIIHRRFANAEAELANGFAEHATMGAEAMLTLELDPATVLAWADRHHPLPTTDRSALSVARAEIERELAANDWVSVLRNRVALLAARLDAHLFHGLIRTAQAARALRRDDGPDGRSELATGLAAWTVWAGDKHGVAPSTAADPLAEILESARRGASAFATSPSIFTLHAVTAPMAYLLLAEYLAADTHAIAAAAFARTHRRHPVPPARLAPAVVPTASELAKLAQHRDAHPAKLVEAALRGYARSGDATFLDAVATMMGP